MPVATNILNGSYENGKREPSLAMPVMMSGYFNVSIDFLITGEEFKKR